MPQLLREVILCNIPSQDKDTVILCLHLHPLINKSLLNILHNRILDMDQLYHMDPYQGNPMCRIMGLTRHIIVCRLRLHLHLVNLMVN